MPVIYFVNKGFCPVGHWAHYCISVQLRKRATLHELWGSAETGRDACPLHCYLAARQEILQKHFGTLRGLLLWGLMHFLPGASVLSV